MVTNLLGTDDYLYDRVYCARGDMENRIRILLSSTCPHQEELFHTVAARLDTS